MSNVSSPANSPIHAEPLHYPSRAAQVVVPQAPLGNATNGKTVSQVPGMGAKALLAKKMAKGSNPKFVSPTDNMMTPCSKKISAAKKKRFEKGTKPTQGGLFQTAMVEEDIEPGSDEEKATAPEKREDLTMDDPENPF